MHTAHLAQTFNKHWKKENQIESTEHLLFIKRCKCDAYKLELVEIFSVELSRGVAIRQEI
jgi:hypothetical protein